MHIQLDAVGGIAGDMFAAAMLDAFPDLEAGTLAAASAAVSAEAQLVPHNDGVLRGHRFLVTERKPSHPHDDHGGGHRHHHHPADHASHGHRPWSDIRAALQGSALEPAVRDAAVAIFAGLAEAEACVHGIDVDAVEFHEVGAWDSIADIVAAAFLVNHCGATSWSVGALPLGSGRVQTAHGQLPVPAPATALLLHGLAVIDDGVPGERVTPTGAAILRFLLRGGSGPQQPRTIGRTGIGFGTKTLPGVSNCLRVLVLDEASPASRGQPTATSTHRGLTVIEFEVDDQAAEDLAMGLDRLRSHPDIFDVVQSPVFGKKGRMMTHVRALARTGADDAIAACFRETTTIGLRHHRVDGAALPRALHTVAVDGRPVRVKTVDRPGGRTAKAEADDAMEHETHAVRSRLRRVAERMALEIEQP